MVLFFIFLAAAFAGSLVIDIDSSINEGESTLEGDVSHIENPESDEANTESSSKENPSEGDSAVGDSHEVREMYLGVEVRTDEASGITHLVGNSSESLVGTSNDELFLIGSGDDATGGGGRDEFVVDGGIVQASSEGLSKVPIVRDFNQELDSLVISLPSPEGMLANSFPDRPDFEGELQLRFENDSTLVLINNLHVLTLINVRIDDPSVIQVIYDYHSTAPTDFDLQYGYNSA